jgi:hypothetical protein
LVVLFNKPPPIETWRVEQERGHPQRCTTCCTTYTTGLTTTQVGTSILAIIVHQGKHEAEASFLEVIMEQE